MPKGIKKKKEIPKISVTTEKTDEEEPTTRKRKTFEELTIQDDYLFKRIMTEKELKVIRK